MKTRRGRRIAIGSALAAVLVLGGVGFASKTRILLEYNLWRLRQPDKAARVTACMALTELKRTEALGSLLEVLSVEVERHHVIWGRPERVFNWLEPEGSKGDYELMHSAMRAFDELLFGSDPRALFPCFGDFLRSKDPFIRFYAVFSLGNHREAPLELQTDLERLSHDADPRVSKAAAWTLKQRHRETNSLNPGLQEP